MKSHKKVMITSMDPGELVGIAVDALDRLAIIASDNDVALLLAAMNRFCDAVGPLTVAVFDETTWVGRSRTRHGSAARARDAALRGKEEP